MLWHLGLSLAAWALGIGRVQGMYAGHGFELKLRDVGVDHGEALLAEYHPV